MEKFEVKSSSFETTGVPGRALEPQRSTGHGRGTIGFSNSEAESARSWLVRQDPAQVDEALGAWVSTLLGAAPKVETELRFPTDEGPQFAPYAVATSAHLPVRSEEDAAQVLRKYQGAMTPPEKPQVENWFYAMRLALASSTKSEMDEVGRMAIYVAELGRYPADVTKAVFDHFTRKPRAGTSWLPTLPEMVAVAERLVSPRRAVIAALQGWKAPSDEDLRRERIRQLLFEAAELDRATFLMKRSAPEKYAAAQAKIAEFKAEADRLRRGEA
jgi:hypothetical protein